MDVEIKLTGRKDVPQNERQSVNVETHVRRGDMFNVLKVDQMGENDTATFRVPPGGRLMIQVPEGDSEVVYDAAQGAAVRRGAQVNVEGRADSASNNEGAIKADLGIGGAQPLSQPQPRPGAPSMQASQPSNVKPPQPSMSPADRAKHEAEARAKLQQQSGSGRPAGETSPKPGSPVGSPPSGNEGQK